MKKIFSLLAILALAPAALAQVPPTNSNPTMPGERVDPMPENVKGTLIMNGACHEDFKTYCADKKDGKGGMRDCIRDNKGKFSEACQAQMKTKHQERKAERKARREHRREMRDQQKPN